MLQPVRIFFLPHFILNVTLISYVFFYFFLALDIWTVFTTQWIGTCILLAVFLWNTSLVMAELRWKWLRSDWFDHWLARLQWLKAELRWKWLRSDWFDHWLARLQWLKAELRWKWLRSDWFDHWLARLQWLKAELRWKLLCSDWFDHWLARLQWLKRNSKLCLR